MKSIIYESWTAVGFKLITTGSGVCLHLLSPSSGVKIAQIDIGLNYIIQILDILKKCRNAKEFNIAEEVMGYLTIANIPEGIIFAMENNFLIILPNVYSIPLINFLESAHDRISKG